MSSSIGSDGVLTPTGLLSSVNTMGEMEFHLASKYAAVKNSTYENECVFRIPQLDAPEMQSLAIQLKSATIPVSWTTIGPYNSTLVFKANNVTYTKSLTQGNYSASTFSAYLTGLSGLPAGLTVTYTKITGKFTFTFTGTIGVGWGFLSTSTCLSELGYYRNTPTLTTSSSFTSPNVVDLTGVNSVLVNTQLLATSYNTQSGSNGDAIARIPVSVQFGGVIDPGRIFPVSPIGDRHVTYIKVTLNDEDGNLIAATTAWQMTLSVSCVPDPSHKYFNSKTQAPSTPTPAAPPTLPARPVKANRTRKRELDQVARRAAVLAARRTRLNARLDASTAGFDPTMDTSAEDAQPPTQDQLDAQQQQTDLEAQARQDQILARLKRGGGVADSQTLGADSYPAPSSREMVVEFDRVVGEQLARLHDPRADNLATSSALPIFSYSSVGPNTVHTNSAAPGPQ